MDDHRWWVGAHGVGPLYPFVDGGGHLSCVLGIHGCWWWLRRKTFVKVCLLLLLYLTLPENHG